MVPFIETPAKKIHYHHKQNKKSQSTFRKIFYSDFFI